MKDFDFLHTAKFRKLFLLRNCSQENQQDVEMDRNAPGVLVSSVFLDQLKLAEVLDFD